MPRLTKFVLILWFYLNICRKLSVIDAIHDFSVWLRTGSNRADSNRFQSHTAFLYINLRTECLSIYLHIFRLGFVKLILIKKLNWIKICLYRIIYSREKNQFLCYAFSKSQKSYICLIFIFHFKTLILKQSSFYENVCLHIHITLA